MGESSMRVHFEDQVPAASGFLVLDLAADQIDELFAHVAGATSSLR